MELFFSIFFLLFSKSQFYITTFRLYIFRVLSIPHCQIRAVIFLHLSSFNFFFFFGSLSLSLNFARSSFKKKSESKILTRNSLGLVLYSVKTVLMWWTIKVVCTRCLTSANFFLIKIENRFYANSVNMWP